MVTLTEYIRVGGVDLDGPAYYTTNLDAFYSLPAQRGDDVLIPFQQGRSPRRFQIDATRKVVPMQIVGRYTAGGGINSDPVAGLRGHIDTLLKAFRPRQTVPLTTLVYYAPDGTVRQADCRVRDFLPVNQRAGAVICNAVLDLEIPGGVLRSDTATEETWTSSGSKTIDNPGTADQFASVITMAAAQKITNTSFGGAWLEYTGTDPITINTATFRATYDAGGTVDDAELSFGGHFRWLPLAPGTNNLTLTTAAETSWSHYAPYL